MQDKDGKNRIAELKNRAKLQGVYTFTDFLSPTDRFAFLAEDGDVAFASYGGAPFAERKMVRYGENCYGSPDFPIAIVHLFPRSAKFATPLSHRDFLGAILALGIERKSVGDIWISGNEAYLAAETHIADFIVKHLQSVGRVAVTATVATEVPLSFAPKTRRERVVLSSLRIDALLSRLYDLSREGGQNLIDAQSVLLVGRPILKGTYEPKEGDLFTVRGYGKFTFCGVCGATKKGKLLVEVETYL